MEDLKARLKFLHDAEVNETTEDAEKQAAKIIEEAKAKAEEIKEQKTKEILQRMREKETLQLELAKIDGRKRIARAKAQLLDEVFAVSKEKLSERRDMSEVNYKRSLDKLVLEAATKLDGTDLEIVVNENDRNYVKENIKRLEKNLAATTKAQIRLSLANEQLVISGGVMVRTRDGSQIFNNTWEARLAKIKHENIEKVLELLFKGVED